MTEYSHQDAGLYDIQSALVGELPSFGKAKESKLQQLMQRNVEQPNVQSPPLNMSSVGNFDTPLSAEAKAFQPLHGNQGLVQSSTSSTIESFENLNISSSTVGGARLFGNQPNPAANEFIPRNLSAPMLSQLHQDASFSIPIPNHVNNSNISQPQANLLPRHPVPSFQDATTPRLSKHINPNRSATNEFPQGVQMASNSRGSGIDPHIATSSVFVSPPSQNNYYPRDTNLSTTSVPFDKRRCGGGRDVRASLRFIEDYVQRLFNKRELKELKATLAKGYPGASNSFPRQPVDALTGTLPTTERTSPLLMRRMGAQQMTAPLSQAPAAMNLNLSASQGDVSMPQEKMDGAYMSHKPLTQESRGTTYFYVPKSSERSLAVMMPGYHIYSGPPPSVEYMNPKANAPSFFMPGEVRKAIMQKHALTMMTVDVEQEPSVPAEVDNYHSLFPLEVAQDQASVQKSGTFGLVTSCYKAIKYKDGLPYCLRRIHGFRQVNEKCMTLVEMWKKLQHSNIVQLREVFTANAFGEHSLIFAHDYHAGAETLMERHFKNNTNSYASKAKWNGGTARQNAGLLPESLIWIYVVQLTSALRSIHSAGLACRVLVLSKILITDKSRIRINGVGILDVLRCDTANNNPRAHMQQYQQEDMIALGRVVLALASNSVTSFQPENVAKSVELVIKNYSNDLKNLVMYLLTSQQRPHSVNDIMPMIGARFYTHLDAAMLRGDVIENELSKEVENGRLFRMLCKLGIVNERPEFDMEPRWSETGDRYLLKLFRDHLFHQVTDTGAPWIDLSHIVQCLNKLDAGVPEKVCLMTRDEQNILVVSYAELKKAYLKCYDELTRSSPSM